MSRHFTALKNGIVANRGTFHDEELLRADFPAPTYSLVLDELLDPPEPVLTYQDKRRLAYPPLSDLADALYWQAQGDNSRMDAYMAAVQAVKDQIPKSN